MSAQPVEEPQPETATVTRLTPAREYERRNQRAIFELENMLGNGVVNFPRILAILKGRA